MPESQSALDKKLVFSIVQLITRSGIIKVISFIGQVLVARLLLPTDFGFFAVIAFIVNFSSLFCDFGSSWAIIQRKNALTDHERSTLFNVKMILTLIVVCGLWFISPLLPTFFPEFTAEHSLLLKAFSISLIFLSLKTVPLSMIERKMQFMQVALLELSGVIMYQVVTLILAFSGYGVWSLVWGVIAKELTETVLSFYFSGWKPQLYIRFADMHHPVRMGGFLQINTVLNFIHGAVVPIAVGRMNGMNSVGLLDWSTKISSIPTLITDSYGRAAFPGFSRLQHAEAMLKKIAHYSIVLLSLGVGLFCTIIFVHGRQIVAQLYSSQWLPALPALYLYTLATLGIAFTATIGAQLLSKGLSKSILLINTVVKIAEWILIFYLYSKFSFLSVPLAAVASAALSAFLYILVGLRQKLFELNWLGTYARIGSAALFAVGGASVIAPSFAHLPIYLQLGVELTTTTLMYICFSYLLLRKEYGLIMAYVQEMI